VLVQHTERLVRTIHVVEDSERGRRHGKAAYNSRHHE
jgi:hypothetical protein